MSKANDYENDLLSLLFQAVAIGSVAAVSTGLTGLQISLHTADPTDTGSQTSNEATYTSYTRIATTRSTAGWVVSSGQASPVSSITFPAATSTSTSTITHFGVGISTGGAGRLYYSGTVTPNVNIGLAVQPILTTGTVISED